MKICILGGGTSGWLAALWITRLQPDRHKVTIVDSSKIGIIGTGEGTTGLFHGLLTGQLLGTPINIAEFFKETKATQKLGNKFVNWHKTPGYYYAPIDNTITHRDEWDISLMYHISKYGLKNAHLSTICGHWIEENLCGFDKANNNSYNHGAYHFDGHMVGKFFKKMVKRDCTIIDSEYVGCKKDEKGNLKSIKLANGQEIYADYFIDATGFARVLNKEVDAGWHSYSKYLTLDTAIPFQTPHEEGKDIRPLTTSTALNAGWMWQVPTQERMGSGYVYDSSCITYDEALRELEITFGKPIEPIKTIKFEPGRVERPFCKNVMSIGLSCAFHEPLQATNIHSQIAMLQYLTGCVLRPDVLPANEYQNKLINTEYNKTLDMFTDLIQTHHKSGRQDTTYWKKTQFDTPMTDRVEAIKEFCNRRWPTTIDFFGGYGSAGYGVFIYPIINNEWINWKSIGVPNADQTHSQWIKTIKKLSSKVHNHQQFLNGVQSGKIKTITLASQTVLNSIHNFTF